MSENILYHCDLLPNGETKPLGELAVFCIRKIRAAENDGVMIDDGNVMNLICDNSDASIQRIRDALVLAGFIDRFPIVTRQWS